MLRIAPEGSRTLLPSERKAHQALTSVQATAFAQGSDLAGIALAAVQTPEDLLVAEGLEIFEKDFPEYDIQWYTLDCGGEVYGEAGQGTQYQLNGTIGQLDADVVVGAYELRGGFWPVFASLGEIFSDGFESGDCCAWSSASNGECCPS